MPRWSIIVFAALVVLYAAVRLWQLDDSCLWFDEIFSIHAAEHEWGPLFWFVAQDLIHPPLFYMLLKIWIGIGGESLMWLRLLPVFFSTLALFPFLHLCRELKLKRETTLLALLFLAVNGSLIKYAQEVRMYAPLLFFSLLSIWLFARFYFRGKNIWLLTLVNILLVYTHYFGWFVIAAEVAAIFIFQRVKIRHVLIMSGIAIATFVPWIIAIARAASAGADVTQNIGWMARPGIREIIRFAFDAIEPFYFQQSSGEPSTLPYITIPLLLVIVVAKVLFFVRWKNVEDKSGFYLMSLFTLVPLIFAFVVSWLAPVSVWGSRHLIIVFAPVAILIAIMLTEIGMPIVRRIAIAFVIVLSVVALARSLSTPAPEFVWCAWEGLSKQWILKPHLASTPKLVYAFEDLAAYHIWFAARAFPNHKVALLTGVHGVTNDPAYFLPRGFEGIEKREIREIKDESLWIAFRKKAPDDDGLISFFSPPSGTPVSELEQLGYSIQDVEKLKVGEETCFLMKLAKQPSP